MEKKLVNDFNVITGCSEYTASEIAKKYNAKFFTSATSAIHSIKSINEFFTRDNTIHVYFTNNPIELRLIEIKSDLLDAFNDLEVYDLHHTEDFSKAIKVLYTDSGMSNLYNNWYEVLYDTEALLDAKYSKISKN